MVCPGAVAANYHEPKRIISCCQAHLIRLRKIKQARVVCVSHSLCTSLSGHRDTRPTPLAANRAEMTMLCFFRRAREKKKRRSLFTIRLGGTWTKSITRPSETQRPPKRHIANIHLLIFSTSPSGRRVGASPCVFSGENTQPSAFLGCLACMCIPGKYITLKFEQRSLRCVNIFDALPSRKQTAQAPPRVCFVPERTFFLFFFSSDGNWPSFDTPTILLLSKQSARVYVTFEKAPLGKQYCTILCCISGVAGNRKILTRSKQIWTIWAQTHTLCGANYYYSLLRIKYLLCGRLAVLTRFINCSRGRVGENEKETRLKLYRCSAASAFTF